MQESLHIVQHAYAGKQNFIVGAEKLCRCQVTIWENKRMNCSYGRNSANDNLTAVSLLSNSVSASRKGSRQILT